MPQTWLLVPLTLNALAAAPVTVVGRPPAEGVNAHYPSNRAPLAPAPLVKLPVGTVAPRGWVRRQLELQANGFHGHLTEISRFLIKEGNAWLSPTGEGDHGWEEVPYWLKGFGDTAYLLGDERLLAETRIWIEGMLASRREDGYFGPQQTSSTVQSTAGKFDLWPNMIALFCLQSYYEHSEDQRVLDLMTAYFRWELAVADDDFLPPFWQQQRAGDNLASVYWLYNRTGEAWLLDLAAKIFRRMARWDEGIASWHNVNIAQCFKSPGLYYQQSRDRAHLAAAERNWRYVREIYGQVPGGMFGADENARPGYIGPRQAIETCGIVEEMLSDEQLAAITGDVAWADRCEDAAFNSLPACITPDASALRYLTAPNMVLSDAANKSPGLQNRGAMLHMNPHGHRCCQHNMGHGWPYFAEHMVMATLDHGLAAVLYGPCETTAKVGDGATVQLTATTHYPFDETITFRLGTPRAVAFPLYLRIPGWCDGATVAVAGEPSSARPAPGTWLRLDRIWADGDTVTLRLPMAVKLRRWAANHDSVSVARGPLTFSLRIGEEYRRAGGTEAWPAYEIHPTTPWNYGLVLPDGEPGAGLHVVQGDWPADEQPFLATAAPVTITAQGRRIPNWALDERGLIAEVQPSPVRTDQPEETIALIPMGCARLRLSAFPIVGDGPLAHDWVLPPEPRIRASHAHGGDTVEAVHDGQVPQDSGDQNLPRFTWWDHRGSEEWIESRFESPREVKAVEVYWFDDTGRGQCRVPQSWRLEAWDGQDWRPVDTQGEYGVAQDTFNRVSISPVMTERLRLVVQLAEGVSGGILEWRIE